MALKFGEEGSGFVMGEDGKWKIAPMKFPDSVQHPGNKLGSGKKGITRKYIPIQPLKFDALFGSVRNSPNVSAKSVRKELFKVPERRSSISWRPSVGSRRSTVVGKKTMKPSTSMRPASVTKRTQVANYRSPLLSIEEAEESLLFQKLSQALPTINVEQAETPRAVHKKTPSSNGSEESVEEFVRIERQLQLLSAKKKKTTISPFMSVINNINLNNSVFEHKTAMASKIVGDLRQLLRQQEELLRQQEELVQQQEKIYKLTKQKTEELIDLVESCSNENKENQVRGVADGNKEDLRKQALKVNLVRSNLQSPRTKKAVDMYNEFRNDLSVLCTPKVDRNSNEHEPTSPTRNLSRRLQQQCLLLHQTPKQG